jgi:hypothetical protein
MKIALCFSGQPRGLKVAYNYYKENLLDLYDVDVFCHSWNSDVNDDILKLYNPKSYKFEDYIFDESYDGKYTNTPNPEKYPPRFTLSSFYSISQSSILKNEYETKNNFVYDWVIRTRYDFALNVKIPFEDLCSNKIYVPNCHMTPEKDFCNDQFAFSNSAFMSKYMNTFSNIDEYYETGVELIGERMLQANIKAYGLVGKNLQYIDVNHPFPPGLHNGTWHSLVREDYESWVK